MGKHNKQWPQHIQLKRLSHFSQGKRVLRRNLKGNHSVHATEVLPIKKTQRCFPETVMSKPEGTSTYSKEGAGLLILQ